MTLEIHVLAWDRHKHMVGLNRLMVSLSPPLITGSPTAIHINDKKKSAQIRLTLKKFKCEYVCLCIFF
jgi:hypothetical protein